MLLRTESKVLESTLSDFDARYYYRSRIQLLRSYDNIVTVFSCGGRLEGTQQTGTHRTLLLSFPEPLDGNFLPKFKFDMVMALTVVQRHESCIIIADSLRALKHLLLLNCGVADCGLTASYRIGRARPQSRNRLPQISDRRLQVSYAPNEAGLPPWAGMREVVEIGGYAHTTYCSA